MWPSGTVGTSKTSYGTLTARHILRPMHFCTRPYSTSVNVLEATISLSCRRPASFSSQAHLYFTSTTRASAKWLSLHVSGRGRGLGREVIRKSRGRRWPVGPHPFQRSADVRCFQRCEHPHYCISSLFLIPTCAWSNGPPCAQRIISTTFLPCSSLPYGWPLQDELGVLR